MKHDEAENSHIPRFLDGHRFDVAVVGVQHHRGHLIHCRGHRNTAMLTSCSAVRDSNV